MKKPATKQFKKELRVTIRKLQQYCHGKNCKLIEECPAEHSHDCCGKLDLDTAMAWDTVLDLEFVLAHLFILEEQKNPKYIYENIVSLINACSEILGALNVRDRSISYHLSKYEKLYKLLGETYWKLNSHLARFKKFVNDTITV